MDPYQELANAVILLAVDDYRDKLRGIEKHGVTESKAFFERFFCGKWFATLTKLDGNLLLKQLKNEYREEQGR